MEMVKIGGCNIITSASIIHSSDDDDHAHTQEKEESIAAGTGIAMRFVTSGSAAV